MPNKDTTIIIIDDDTGITDMTSELLSMSGYKTITLDNVKSAKEVEDIIIENSPALIILDLWMPGISGEDLTKSLKSNEKTKSTPIIISSAHRNTEGISKTAGADDFIVKPFNITDLENIVSKYISK